MTYEETKEIYRQVIEMSNRFELKGKSMPFSSSIVHMFSHLNKDGQLGLRLSEADGEQFKRGHDSDIFKSYGAVMKGYVLIPESVLNNIELLGAYMDKSYEYVMSLEPKK